MMSPVQKKQARARRQRVPAFGEWNHAYGYGGGGGDQRPVVTHYDLDTAMQMQARRLVVAIPAVPPKPASKVRYGGDDDRLHVLVRCVAHVSCAADCCIRW